MSQAAVIPDRLHGRINDLDSHLQIPASRWGQVFGEIGARLGERFTGLPFFDDTDVAPLDRTSVWTTKGTSAPGAATPAGRLAALEVMGIDRQLVFPQVVMASMAWQHDEDAGAIRRAYNDAVIDWTSEGGGRLRPAALLSAHDLDDAVAEAQRVIAAGFRAVLVQDGVPTGGRSPASKQTDTLWSMLAEADVATLLHLGGQKGFFGTEAWSDTDTLRDAGPGAGELFSPQELGTMTFPIPRAAPIRSSGSTTSSPRSATRSSSSSS